MLTKADRKVRTWPPANERDYWRAMWQLDAADFDANRFARPYEYIGRGATEAEAIEDLRRLEDADASRKV